MTNQEILGKFLSLPAEAQIQVVNLIVFLKQKHLYSEPQSGSPNIDLMNDPFIGMWRDREDLSSTTWLRNLRETEWLKTDG
ncbi:hypothetical protein PCC8801_4040 [Rippkaea orientalis PCC 8801]|uniref:DUF2281 domain-containing protein n=1 Tax=Rippkaea orientalis (strain PCC 8801 / RF-1) TaxID=41431 RepID=B7K5S5_RIPO1|nr:hypothetical protein [Rippkaea orientalis]ACK67978.1 hypothetical protein PCC8801_4040 [Rippkaea orientalis PCC 8801]